MLSLGLIWSDPAEDIRINVLNLIIVPTADLSASRKGTTWPDEYVTVPSRQWGRCWFVPIKIGHVLSP